MSGTAFGVPVASTLTAASRLHARTIEVQLKVTSTPSCSEDIANMFKGLTRQINSVCIDVKIVSVAISVRSNPSISYRVSYLAKLAIDDQS